MNTENGMTVSSRSKYTMWVTTVILLAIAALIPFFLSGYQRTLMQKAFLWIPAVFGVYIMYSLLRQVHFGQSIFVGLGSYITALLAGQYGITNELAIMLPVALVITLVMAYVLGIFITKRTGFYFAVMTIAVTMVFWSLVYKARAITGGSDGISHIKAPTLFSLPLGDMGFYYFCVVVSVGMIFLMLRVLNSSFALQLRAIAGDLDKAESIGIPVKRMQIVAFVIAGVNAGITGVLLAFLYNYVCPSIFDWGYGSNFVQSAIIGGTNCVAGPIVGAFGFINLEFFISTWFASLWEIVIGLTIAIIVVTVGEQGITGVAQIIYGKLRTKLRNS